MHDGRTVDFGVGLESRGKWAGGPAFRCGLPFRGDGRPTRNAGTDSKFPATLLAGALIEVRWLPDVSWRKRIRFSNRK